MAKNSRATKSPGGAMAESDPIFEFDRKQFFHVCGHFLEERKARSMLNAFRAVRSYATNQSVVNGVLRDMFKSHQFMLHSWGELASWRDVELPPVRMSKSDFDETRKIARELRQVGAHAQHSAKVRKQSKARSAPLTRPMRAAKSSYSPQLAASLFGSLDEYDIRFQSRESEEMDSDLAKLFPDERGKGPRSTRREFSKTARPSKKKRRNI